MSVKNRKQETGAADWQQHSFNFRLQLLLS